MDDQHYFMHGIAKFPGGGYSMTLLSFVKDNNLVHLQVEHLKISIVTTLIDKMT